MLLAFRCGRGEERSNWTSCIARAFPSSVVTAKRSTWRAKRTAFGKPSISEFCHVMFLVRTWSTHTIDEVIAVHVSKSRDLLQLYQLAAVTEPNFIEISKLPIHNRAVLHLSADIQPDRGEFGKFLMIGGRGRQNPTYATATQLTVDPCLLSWQTRQPYLSVLCKELLSKLS